MGGFMEDNLFNKIIQNTGLPQDLISEELGDLLKNAGVEKTQVTLDELRDVLSNYLQDVLLKAKDDLGVAD